MMFQVEGHHYAPTLFQGFRKLYRDNGLKGLWRGNLLSIAKNFPESGIFWVAYESARGVIAARSGKRKSALSKAENFVCGSFAGSVGFVLLYPFDVIRTRYSVVMRSNATGSSLKNIIRKTWTEHGFRSFYGGIGPGLLSIVPFAGTRLAAYEAIKSTYLSTIASSGDENQVASLSRWAPLAAGPISSACGQLVSFPLYTMSVKMQTQFGKNMFQVAKNLVKTEGFRGLYRGLGASLLKVLPSSSISFLVYEEAKILMLSAQHEGHHHATS
jgi:solute carrier family 25 phosphate transporter 23/24/25/41